MEEKGKYSEGTCMFDGISSSSWVFFWQDGKLENDRVLLEDGYGGGGGQLEGGDGEE